MSELDPLRQHAIHFLDAVRGGEARVAWSILNAHPDIASYSIHTAAATGDAVRVAACVESDGASATRRSPPHETEPLIYAVTSELKKLLGVSEAAHLETVRILLDAGASANASVAGGDPPSSIPVLYFPCAENQVALARLLLERGATPNDGESVYHAAQHDHRDCLELLLAFGADLSARHPEHDNTPLYFLAAHRESNPISAAVTRGMQWLLEHGADPTVASHVRAKADGTPGDAEMPLHRAAASGRGGDVARMLLEHGAAVDAPRGDGASPYVLAVRAGNVGMSEYLASVGADATRLSVVDRFLGACARADEAAVRDIIAEQPTIVTILTFEERQALGLAVVENREASVALMLSLGWPLIDEGEWGGTPLHWAAWHGRLPLVRALLHHGAPVNLRDTAYGSSPIAWAAHGSRHAGQDRDGDYSAIVHLLLDAGATRMESFNQWKESPESMASEEVQRALRARGFTE